MDELQVSSAEANVQAEWLSLLFASLSADDRVRTVRAFLEASRRGDISLEGLLGVRFERRLLGTVLYLLQPDRTAFVWPASTAGLGQASRIGREDIADALLQEVARRLDAARAWLGQCLVEPERSEARAALSRNGFAHLADLLFLERSLSAPPPSAPAERFEVVTFSPGENEARFVRVLERTYEGTLDCPDLEGLRSASEALASHRLAGAFEPTLWQLVRVGGEDVGVLLMAEHPDRNARELVYLGVVPEARGRGYGRAVTSRALREAAEAGRDAVFLAVDERNVFARRTYERLGFVETDRRALHARPGPRR